MQKSPIKLIGSDYEETGLSDISEDELDTLKKVVLQIEEIRKRIYDTNPLPDKSSEIDAVASDDKQPEKVSEPNKIEFDESKREEESLKKLEELKSSSHEHQNKYSTTLPDNERKLIELRIKKVLKYVNKNEAILNNTSNKCFEVIICSYIKKTILY